MVAVEPDAMVWLDGWVVMVGAVPDGATLRIPVPVSACPSGLMIVTFFGPGDADTVERSRVTVVGLTYVAELTITPPVTDAVRRFAKPGPGSKKPEPADDVPVIVTLVDATPAGIDDGLAEAGVAGGGASSLATLTP